MKGDREQITGVICSDHAWRAGFADRVADDDVAGEAGRLRK
jgi:hypothetical protein